ncbi:MAG TPA: NAD(P)H-dependent oxidoreductase subunit E [Mariprofundaceae bacterium]|nr:NAD(P)H-dependent oxidoreductase subunit E [Mariprofundaceae bacterium]
MDSASRVSDMPDPATPRQAGEHLLHVLYEVQQRLRHIPREAVCDVAARLGLPVSQVEAVADFYSFFSRTPRGRYDILFSTCTSCGPAHGETDLLRMLCDRLGVVAGQTRADGIVSIGSTSCIGMCDQGPAALVNGMPLTRLDARRLAAMAERIEAGTPLTDWPEEWFGVADHVLRPGLLLASPWQDGAAIRASLKKGPEAMLAEITRAGLRGRGGAGFGTGMKWSFCRQANGGEHYVVCNADEGEPGTFKDRVLLASHADMVCEGMSVCAHVIGARRGFLYLRGEYRYLLPQLEATLARRRQAGLLGTGILGHAGFDFDIDIIVGAGAYICGEESAVIESMEQKRGIPRIRPPFPVTHGYLGQPTVVNNVETLAAAAAIAVHGADWFTAQGTDQSKGSKLISISGDCAAPGIYEYPFGVSMRKILDDCGAQDVQAVQIGGPSGTLIGPAEFERRLAFEDLATGGSLMVYGRQRDLLAVIRNFAHFFAHESCGFCTPCRVGTSLLKNGLDKIARGHGTHYDVDEMRRLATLIKRRSHCGLGQTAPNPILDVLSRFPEAIDSRLAHSGFEPYFDLDASLEEARLLSHRDDAEAHLR